MPQCVTAQGRMVVTNKLFGRVAIKVCFGDGERPLPLRVRGKIELAEHAFRQASVRLEVFGQKFQTKVLRFDPATSSLLVASEPLHRALGRDVRTQRSRMPSRGEIGKGRAR